MSDAKPPAPAPGKSGWFDRLLELGNNNKLIAAATLITIATGLPYLVMSAVGLVSGEAAEEDEAAVTIAMLEAALAASLQKVQAQAVEATESGAPYDGDAVATTGDALSALGEQARRPEATEEEREQVLEAYREYSTGNPAVALAQFARIAEEQVGRGADDAAARTLRHRGALQFFTDPEQALDDYLRAEELSAGSATDHLRIAMLLPRNGPESVRWMRSAIRQAREEEDLEVLATALFRFSTYGHFLDYLRERGLESELEAAIYEGTEVLDEVITLHPEKLEFVWMEVILAYRTVVGGSAQAFADYHDLLHRRIDSVEKLQHVTVREARRLGTLATLRARHGNLLLNPLDDPDWREECDDALDDLRRCLAAPDRQVQDMGDFTFAASVLHTTYRDAGNLDQALAAAECYRDLSEEADRLRGRPGTAHSAIAMLVEAHVDLGDVERAEALLREAIDESRAAYLSSGDARDLDACINLYADGARRLHPAAPDRAVALLDEVLAFARGNLEGEALALAEDYVARQRARLAAGDGAAGGGR